MSVRLLPLDKVARKYYTCVEMLYYEEKIVRTDRIKKLL